MADPITDALQKCRTQRYDRLGDALGCLGLLAQSPGKSHHIEVHTELRCTDHYFSFSCDPVNTYVVAEGPGSVCPSLQFRAKPVSKSADQTGFTLWGLAPNLAHPLLDARACQEFLQRTTPEKNWRVCSSRTKDGAYVHTVEWTDASPNTPCELSCRVLLNDPVSYSSGLVCQGTMLYKVPSGGNYNW